MKTITAMSLHVDDYDEAIAWYSDKLGFILLYDEKISDSFRFVRISPCVSSQFSLVLVKSEAPDEHWAGRQAKDVLLFLNTDDFWYDYKKMQDKGVEFCESPREEVYATVVVFKDLYGNKWDLIQPK